jgi:hypothetical protein
MEARAGANKNGFSTSAGALGSALLTGGSAASAAGFAGTGGRGGVTDQQLMLFLFPSSLEHPESTGRLELFARYGPTDAQGRLHNVHAGGSRANSDLEIRLMVEHEVRERLFGLFKKPRDTVEVIVDSILPVALSQNYTRDEVSHLLRGVARDGDGNMEFANEQGTGLQQVILANQRRRLQAILKDGVAKKERGPRVAFQNKAAEILLKSTQKKKQNEQEEMHTKQKRLTSCTLIASLEEQNLSSQLMANVVLMRNPGDVDDKWDRYCAMRRVGKASYVKARNEAHTGIEINADTGTGQKHVGASSLLACGLVKRS